MTKIKLKSQLSFIKEFFSQNPNVDHKTTDIKKIIETNYLNETGKRFEDCDRGIRSLYQQGWLIKVKKGIYKYDPSFSGKNKTLHDFTDQQKKQILKRDGYKCILCKMGKKEGAELHIDHVKPRDKGGKSTIENGQTLCSRCNFLKKNMNIQSLGKKIFINLLTSAKKENNIELQKFAEEILDVFKKYKLD